MHAPVPSTYSERKRECEAGEGGQRPAHLHHTALDCTTSARWAAGPGTPVTRHGSGASAHLVDVRPWELRWTDFVIRRPLGAGSFGKVYLADLHNTPVAVKVLLDATAGSDQAGAAALSISSPMLAGLVGVSACWQRVWGW